MSLTRYQMYGIHQLAERHARYPDRSGFFTSTIGPRAANALRQIGDSLFVKIDKRAPNCFVYSLTEAGREFARTNWPELK